MKGELEGLAEGLGGFGVLRTTPEHLEVAAKGAEGMGDQALAAEFRRFAQRLPSIRDENAARQALQDFTPLQKRAWGLAKRCGGGNLSPELYKRAQELAQKVKAGEMTKEQAVDSLKQGA